MPYKLGLHYLCMLSFWGNGGAATEILPRRQRIKIQFLIFLIAKFIFRAFSKFKFCCNKLNSYSISSISFASCIFSSRFRSLQVATCRHLNLLGLFLNKSYNIFRMVKLTNHVTSSDVNKILESYHNMLHTTVHSSVFIKAH